MAIDRNQLSAGMFHRAVSALREGTNEQVLIERSLGRALLDRVSGRSTDLGIVYRGFGGDDPITTQLFAELTPVLDKLDVTRAQAVARDVINRGDLAASKSSVVAENPLFNVETTALGTLAAIGGDEFKKQYKIG